MSKVKGKPIVIIGAGGFGRECAEIIRNISTQNDNIRCIGFIDDDQKLHGQIFNGIPVLGDMTWFEKQYTYDPIYYVCGIADGMIRKKLVRKVEEYGAIPTTIIHPDVWVFYGAKIGKGVVIQMGARIAVNTQVGDHVHINFNSSIGHDAILHDFVTINPLVGISGNCEIGEGSMFGTNSSIIQMKKVGQYSKIGANACVIKDIPSFVTVVGVPAKIVWKREKVISYSHTKEDDSINDHHAFTG